MFFPPYHPEKFKIYLCETDTSLCSTHALSLDTSIFEIIKMPTLEECFTAAEQSDYGTVLISSAGYQTLHPDLQDFKVSLIVVAENEFNLKNKFFSTIPAALAHDTYLAEFIYWAIEKKVMARELKKKNTKKEQVSQILKKFETILKGDKNE